MTTTERSRSRELFLETSECKVMRKMQENSRTIKEGLMEKLEENSRTLKEMLEEKVNTINEKLEEKVNTVKDEVNENSRKTKEELNHRADEVFQKCEKLQKKYALLTTWDYAKKEKYLYKTWMKRVDENPLSSNKYPIDHRLSALVSLSRGDSKCTSTDSVTIARH
ncbi:hypothetical protein FQA39_LY18304 [Lamprigera yunnana]|nr:hypothetical protein FQA39_LY18304 [Lamprigera yunnana]